jgi:hypothetical protein
MVVVDLQTKLSGSQYPLRVNTTVDTAHVGTFALTSHSAGIQGLDHSGR